MMIYKQPLIIKDLLNEECNRVQVSIGNTLIFGFGEKTQYVVNEITLSKYEWECHTYSSSWRIINESDLICGSFDNEEKIATTFSNMNLKKLLQLKQTSNYDISLFFEENYRVDLLAQSSDEDSFTITHINDKSVSFKPNTGWILDNKVQIPLLTEKEKLLAIHSEQCFERWSLKLPINKYDDTCENCSYYRPLKGEYYFWDYGICSNKNSDFDGQLIGIKSGCEQYSIQLIK